MNEQELPRTPEEIVRRVDTELRLKEVRELIELKDALRFRWHELVLLAGLMAFGIGVGATIVAGLPKEPAAKYWFMVFWLMGFLVMNLVVLEFLIRKFRTLRRLQELTLKRLENLERAAVALAKAISGGVIREDEERAD